MVRAEDVISIYESLYSKNIQVWLVGGWGIDALLQEQTRPHKDLDIIALVDDIASMRDLLGRAGFELKELWSESKWTTDSYGNHIATAFVLHDSEGREVDTHAMRLDHQGNGVPAWAAEGFIFTQEDLSGEGVIAAFSVRCISPQMQALSHTGYDLPPEQLRDMGLLRERLGVEHPSLSTLSCAV